MDSARDLHVFDHFEAVFNNSLINSMLVMDSDGKIIAVNGAFSINFGYTEDDVRGQNFAILFTPEDRERKLPQNELYNVLHTGRSSDNNYLIAKDRTLTWVSGESVLLRNKEGRAIIFKIIQNIHEQKLSEISLTHLNNFNENILGSIQDVVLILDEHLNVVRYNQAFSVLFKYSEDKNENKALSEIIGQKEIIDEFRKIIQHAIRTRSGFKRTVALELLPGEKKVFEVSCNLIMQAQDRENVLLVMHDMSEQKRLERKWEDLIGFIAHELRNPLAVLILCNDMIADALKDNDSQNLSPVLIRNKSNLLRLSKMIGGLYDSTKLSADKMSLDIAFFNFSDMVKEAIDTLQVLHPANGIVIHGDADIQVEGDRYRLMQVLTNYLSNGIKYSGKETEVVVTVIYDHSMISVSVQDEGKGISATQLPFIFDRFFRASQTKDMEGIGLGLYLCKQIIEAHNGQVWAESIEAKGSTFYFSIPLHHAPGS